MNGVPRHVAIIMDGNGRWAQQRGNARSFGHINGKLPVQESIEAAIEMGVECLTLFAFSTENWKRPEDEVRTLMNLLAESLKEHKAELLAQGVRIRTIGLVDALPEEVQKELRQVQEESSKGDKLTLVVALNYGGRSEIVSAARRLVEEAQRGAINPEDIDEPLFESYLQTAGLPEVELMIRTSGEQRISNFLLWQCAYAELLFLPVLWPDFRKADFFQAVEVFKQRNRRFGGV